MHDDESEPDEGFLGDESDEAQDGLVRLNKFMAELGVASRRKCDELIASGKVSVDGEPCVELGTKIDPEKQVVDVNGVVLKPLAQRRRYYLLNKPRHVLCTNEPREMRTRAIDLITDRNKGRIFTVGRLDEDSSGLIILTNDGAFSNRIAHPRHSVPKTYLVKVRGRIDEEALQRISEGVRLSEGKTGGAALFVERRSSEASVLTVTIREGKNREIRRVFAAMGYKVLRLHRVRIGALSDRRLKEGEWRPLTPEEVADLLDVASNKERADTLFAKARQGGFAQPSEKPEDGARDTGRRGERRGPREGARSRFGGARREWREPKEFRIKDPERARRRSEGAHRPPGRGAWEGEAPAHGGRAPDAGESRGRDDARGGRADRGGARRGPGFRPSAGRGRAERASEGARGEGRPDVRGGGRSGARSGARGAARGESRGEGRFDSRGKRFGGRGAGSGEGATSGRGARGGAGRDRRGGGERDAGGQGRRGPFARGPQGARRPQGSRPSHGNRRGSGS